MAFGPSSISLQIRWLVVDIVSDREATLDLGVQFSHYTGSREYAPHNSMHDAMGGSPVGWMSRMLQRWIRSSGFTMPTSTAYG
jgi:hypothetical protein